ncbi:sulfite reductase [Rhodothalassium salexigens]|uniref:nitrite/sulfite reductase n=1 Tax=Rhodothalassium salexigens TaxID=1086 RepID=UPI00191125C4|nr:nitrite/sulfite reductase [Rhodothalassium salexigens]MBK5912675.1 sulfite reductase [Rhodothalassium salexigens]MBK5920254.1 sulfite reductase [Rhodothalassium salexigens]
MYRYDEYDHALVRDRIAEFRDQVTRRLSGELSEDEFKPLRLMNGLYLQLHAYMLRVAIPYGTLSSAQMRRLARIARLYDKGYAHFTTRQNVQYNWPALKDVPDILAELADVEMHAIQTSGNCIRNVTSDQFAGAAADEIADPRPYAELIRQWSMLHPEFSYLPRKFKVAVVASPNDRAAVRLHDVGLILHDDAEHGRGFEVIVGGGMGRSPFVGPTIRRHLPEGQLLRYLDAILRTYNWFGRRDNKYKARIKILVHEMGAEAFARAVEAEFARLGDANREIDRLAETEMARLQAFFAAPTFEAVAAEPAHVLKAYDQDTGFRLWMDHNVMPHRQPGYASAVISLKPHGGIPGDATAEQMEAVADLADRFDAAGEIRVTHEQNLVLPHVKKADLPVLFAALARHGLATANAGLVTDIIACPGLDYCALANARSIPLAQKIAARFDDLQRLADIGEVKIKISGCINACGHHHAGHIGILGVDKKGDEAYQLLLGGSGAEDASLAQIVGPGFSEDGIVDAVATVIDTYLSLRERGERFLDTYRRLGADPFKEALYAPA